MSQICFKLRQYKQKFEGIQNCQNRNILKDNDSKKVILVVMMFLDLILKIDTNFTPNT